MTRAPLSLSLSLCLSLSLSLCLSLCVSLSRARARARALARSLSLLRYLPWQAVHSPYDDVPGWDENGEAPAGTYRGMLWLADAYVGRLVAALRAKGMWDDALLLFTSDNGARGDGLNSPLRGEKRTNFEGAMRVPAFVAGGVLPAAARGTTRGVRLHISDWYPRPYTRCI